MKGIFLFIILSSIINCEAQNNVKITFKDYVYEFKAESYPKSIIDSYKTEGKYLKLSDREIAIKINAEIILEDLIDNILRYNFIQNIDNINELNFNTTKEKLTEYYKLKGINFFTEEIIINRTQQWFADSIVQRKYGGEIYYDSLKRTPKPKEAYKNAVLILINNGEILITDDFLKSEIFNILNNYLGKDRELKCDFYKIETWNLNE